MRVDHSTMTPPAHRPQVLYEWTTLSWLHLHTDCSHHESGPLYHDSTCTQTTGVIWVDHSIMTPTAHLSSTYHATLPWICQRSTITVGGDDKHTNYHFNAITWNYQSDSKQIIFISFSGHIYIYPPSFFLCPYRGRMMGMMTVATHVGTWDEGKKPVLCVGGITIYGVTEAQWLWCV